MKAETKKKWATPQAWILAEGYVESKSHQAFNENNIMSSIITNGHKSFFASNGAGKTINFTEPTAAVKSNYHS